MHSRVADLLGIDIPIIQAPMGYIARAQLASAVSNAGGMGIVETSSGKLDQVKAEFEKMRDLTDKPWGVNVAQLLIRDPAARDEIIDLITGHGVRFVTTSAGDPAVIAPIAAGCRHHGLPCRADPARRAEGGRRRRRRSHHRGGRGRRFQEPQRCLHDGAGAADRRCRRPADRLRPVASATASRWPPRSRSAPRASRWAPGC